MSNVSFMGRLGGIVCGAFAASVVGACVGAILWALVLHSGTPLPESLLAGGVFGLVVGGAGGAARAVLLLLAAPLAVASVIGVMVGAALGVWFGVSFHGGVVEPLMYGAFGAIGAAVAVGKAGRPIVFRVIG